MTNQQNSDSTDKKPSEQVVPSSTTSQPKIPPKTPEPSRIQIHMEGKGRSEICRDSNDV
jgi:hypothetical protein